MTPRTTPFGRACAASAAATIAGGLAFGNFILLLAGGFLLAALLLARPQPRVAVARAVEPTAVRAGERVTVTRTVSSGGPVVVHDTLPDAFRLDEGASNVRAGAGALDAGYAGTAARRGAHVLPATRAVVLDPLGSAEPAEVDVASEATIVVEATGGRIGRVRAPRSWGASQYAEGDAAVRGPKTNEFRELRDYSPGDPLKIVNWKATARASSHGEGLKLLVNEYEPEGKKAIWIFLDAGPGTAKGTTQRDLLDILVEGALAAADHYLGRGHRVGLAIYGAKPQVVYPDHGREQYRRFVTILTHVKQPPSGEPVHGLSAAVEAAHGFLVREKPLLLLFSSLRDPRDTDGLTRAQVLAASGRRPAPAILVLATLAPSSGPDAVVDRLAEAKGRALAVEFQKRGARVLRWNPDETPLAALLAMGVR